MCGMSPLHSLVTSFTEAQRLQALERFHLIRPFLEDGVPLTPIAAQYQLQSRIFILPLKQAD